MRQFTTDFEELLELEIGRYKAKNPEITLRIVKAPKWRVSPLIENPNYPFSMLFDGLGEDEYIIASQFWTIHPRRLMEELVEFLSKTTLNRPSRTIIYKNEVLSVYRLREDIPPEDYWKKETGGTHENA